VGIFDSRRVAEIAEENKPNGGRHSPENSEEPFATKKLKRSSAASRNQNELPQKIAKIAERKQHKSLSMRSLRSFAAKIFLELRDLSLLHCKKRT